MATTSPLRQRMIEGMTIRNLSPATLDQVRLCRYEVGAWSRLQQRLDSSSVAILIGRLTSSPAIC